MPEVVALVTHHPDRAQRCLVRAVKSLTKATSRSLIIDLRVQGSGKLSQANAAAAIKAAGKTPVRVTHYAGNQRPAVPRVDSEAFLRTTKAKWWAKLDDDGYFPPQAVDHLIGALQECEAPAACAMANPEGRTVPKMLVEEEGGPVRCQKGVLAVGASEWARWTVCELVGDGCTVFRREVFGICHWDARFEVSADIDMAMQLKRAGYVCLLCDPPRAGHYHRECSPVRYDRVRYDYAAVQRSAKAFKEKWGVNSSYLRNVRRRF